MKIVLLGDSIRMGYAPGVRDRLADLAEVAWPPENCGHSFRLREHLNEWAIEPNPDVIHFNCGIHDLGWMPGEKAPRFTAREYARNLRLVIERLRCEADATVFFATTTPFLAPCDKTLAMNQCNPATIVARYNKAAMKVMYSLSVPVDDLYQAIMNADPDECLQMDKIHFNDHGNAVLANAVTTFLKQNLSL